MVVTMNETTHEDAVKGGLVGVAEIADVLGVPRTTVSMWASRRAASGFPAPIETLAMGPVYSMSSVREWYDARKASK